MHFQSDFSFPFHLLIYLYEITFLLDVLPIETARARFLQIVLDNFITEHIMEKRGTCMNNIVELGDDKSNKRKSTDVQYEGDPRFVLPLMYVANLYETMVTEANMRIALLNGLREKTIGVALEASGGLYRKLTQKYPKTGSVCYLFCWLYSLSIHCFLVTALHNKA